MNKRELTLFAGLSAAVMAAGFANVAHADKLADVLARGKLIVGTGSTNPPWHFRDEAGNLAGFDIDVAKIVAKGLFDDPEKVEFVIQASDARVPNVVTDKVDITCQFMTVTAARAQLVNFTIPYYREGVGLLLTKDGKYKSHDEMKAAGSAVTVSVLQNPDKYLDSGYGWNPQTYACAVKRGEADWLNFVNTALHEAMTGVEFGTYSASFQKWFGEAPPAPKIGFPSELN